MVYNREIYYMEQIFCNINVNDNVSVINVNTITNIDIVINGIVTVLIVLMILN